MQIIVDKNKPAVNTHTAEKIREEWSMDPKGYFLIEPHEDEDLIYAHHYKTDTAKKGDYHCSIVGRDVQEIYYTILRKELISKKMHAAYLGMELQKAETFLDLKKKGHFAVYIQDDPLYVTEEMYVNREDHSHVFTHVDNEL